MLAAFNEEIRKGAGRIPTQIKPKTTLVIGDRNMARLPIGFARSKFQRRSITTILKTWNFAI